MINRLSDTTGCEKAVQARKHHLDDAAKPAMSSIVLANQQLYGKLQSRCNVSKQKCSANKALQKN